MSRARKTDTRRQRRERERAHLVARYTCGHALPLPSSADPDLACVACGRGELLGLLECAA